MVRTVQRIVAVACVLLFGGALARAQVQAYTVQVLEGFNAVANHLDNGSNTLREVLPNVPGGTRFYKWNPATQSYAEPAEFIPGIGWIVTDPFVNRFAPGEGAFLESAEQFSVLFQGQVHVPQPRVDAVAGYNFVSCQTIEPCSFEDVFGFRPLPGDIVYKLDRAIPVLTPDLSQAASSIHRYGTNGWDKAPSFTTGRSAFVFLVGTPRIVRGPTNQTVVAGATVQLSVEAVGARPLRYHWRKNGISLPNQQSRILQISPVSLSDAGVYSVVVSNSLGTATSAPARLTVLGPPRILEQPRSLTRVVGEMATFKVVAEGTAPLRYRWRHDGTAIPGGTNDVLTIPAVSPNHAGKYTVEVFNAYGQVLSETATLSVLFPPMIAIQPRGQTVEVNATVTFFVEATGTQPLSYQWLRNGVNIPGATNSFLTLQGVQPGDGGSYRVVVANAAGAIQSEPALLRVNVPFLGLADRFADRPLIGDPNGTFFTSNRFATRDPGEPIHVGKPGGASVWMAWTSTQAGIVTFRTRGSHIDTLLAAYVGSQVNALTEVASDEDTGGFLTSAISFNVLPNTIYSIVVGGYNAAEGEIILEWSFEATTERLPVITQQPRDQIVKPGSDVTFVVQTDTPNATFQWFFNGQLIPMAASSPVLTLLRAGPERAGLYYVRVTSGRRSVISRMVTLQFNSDGPDGSVVPFFSFDKFGDVVIRPAAEESATVQRFDASTMQSFSGPTLQSMSIAGGAVAAAGAPIVHGYTGTQVFSTFGAVKDEGEPNHCGVIGGASYWFSYMPPDSGQLFLNTHGSSYDTVLAVYTATGPTYSNLVSVACDNNSGTNGFTSRVDFPATAGTPYYVVVDGVNAASGNVQLNYALLLPVTLENPVMGNSFRFHVTATPSYPVTIQHSADLQAWTSMLTTNTASGSFDFLDTNSAVLRFYRALQNP